MGHSRIVLAEARRPSTQPWRPGRLFARLIRRVYRCRGNLTPTYRRVVIFDPHSFASRATRAGSWCSRAARSARLRSRCRPHVPSAACWLSRTLQHRRPAPQKALRCALRSENRSRPKPISHRLFAIVVIARSSFTSVAATQLVRHAHQRTSVLVTGL